MHNQEKFTAYNYIQMLRYSFMFFSMFLASTVVVGQEWDENGAEIEDARVVIEKDRKIELPTASRSYEKVPPLPGAVREKTLDYDFKDYSHALKPLDPRIRVLTVQDEKLRKFYGNYLKVGLGNYTTPYLEGFFNNKRNDRYAVGAHVKHLSSKNGPVDKENSGTSENKVGLYGKLFTKALTFGGDLKYERRKNNFYGYAPGLETSEDGIKQVYNFFHANLGFVSNTDNEDLYYQFNVSFDHLADHYETSESQVGFDLETRFTLSELLELGLNSDLYLSKINSTGSISRNFFRLNPTFKTTIDPLEIEAGLNLVYEDDTLFNANKVHFYPVAKATYHISEDVKVYAGLGGDVERVSLQHLSRENPFIATGVPVFNTNKTLEFYGALEGKIFSTLAFKGGFSVGNYKNMYYYVNSQADSAQFDILYDNGNTSLFNLFAELGVSKSEVFNLVFRTDYYGYDPDDLEEAWHKPKFGLSLLGTYNLYNKLLFGLELASLGGIKGYNQQSDRQESLDPMIDLNFKTEYLFSDRASLFLNFNNILGNNNERYLNYPSRKFMFMAGLTYSF